MTVLASLPTPDRRMRGASADTRPVILDVAERLFSQNGVEGTSIRDIIRVAGVNLGAINYHFGTKDRLALEVFARRLQPVNRERIARLDVLEKEAGARSVKLESIIDALICPAMEAKDAVHVGCDGFMRLVNRAFQEPNPELKKFVEEQFAEVAHRFDAAILRAVPGLGADELFWRMNFVFGALHHAQQVWLNFDPQRLPQLNLPPARPERAEFIRRIITFITAGLLAAVDPSIKPKTNRPAHPAQKRPPNPTP